ncbi:serine dehydratase subunit alpha family protein [Aeromonas veronii]|uniref:L-cysteine desulfidase family protein n=1 Tax=Aeromonas TaxID=642 RepID=UPI001431DF43|nr:L-serine ammonia-lyase, iron-sulfur-dependent, subunit alpha [Aeromonas veronii]EKP0316314.1 serine dehydratase subunit alpha family protein [Aeromonas veronii]MBL0592344.1 serine dehydratase subunit alpha family protein [Aeromonas veronii]MCF5716325.1 L-serine ammonia-lyase, iron-sulfur-dependent, subunit alpha [Aeromonas veronii]MCJ8233440.1 L-serine ammonia-lyase, iron-sulfur-dependent, subunit alpha [Aeromonas veronii]MCX4044517.1 L-serine ammonia-lyase, iron-sulfur-dependent, subunit a
MKQAWQQYLQIIQQVVKPALGCTEPIAAAYAAAVATRQLGCEPGRLEVAVSDNLYKNSMGVYVPGTGKIGLAIAAAAGAIGGNADAGLEVLAAIQPEQVDRAQQLIDAGKVQVSRTAAPEFIFCRVTVYGSDDKGEEHSAEVTLCGGHTRIVEQRRDGEVTFTADQSQGGATGSICDGVDISIAAIYEFATQVEFEQIRFILKASELNGKLSAEGMNNPYGLEIGRTMQQNINAGLIGEDVMNRIVMMTAAASDARMGGATLPAMSNFGSGNQGIAATIPVMVIAERFAASEEQLARALIMSHLGAIYIKSHYPPLSAFCGNTVTSAAASMAMVYLAGGSFEQSCFAIQNVLSDSAGMVCDGAKASCAMKVSTSSGAAVRGFLMALNSHSVSGQGIVAGDVDQTIRNVGQMVKEGMSATDSTIIDIMSA